MTATIACSSPPSERLLRALAPFGLRVRRAPGERPPPHPDHLGALLDLPPGALALLCAPSGCGKSTLLRAVADHLSRRAATTIDPQRLLRDADPARPIADLFTIPVATSIRLLGAAGLSEAPLWARTPAELSEGQRARLGLALAMARAAPDPAPWLLIDEFCSTLDRVTAAGVAATLRRWLLSSPHARVIAATAHDDLAPSLTPDLSINPTFNPAINPAETAP